MRIARELGGMTPDELARRLTVAEYHEFAAVYALEHEEHEEARRKARAERKGRR